MHCLTVTNSVGPISDPARLGSTNGIKGGLTISIPAAARHTLLYVDDELIPCIAYVANMYTTAMCVHEMTQRHSTYFFHCKCIRSRLDHGPSVSEAERCCPQQGQRQQELLRSRLQFEQGLVALCRVRSEFLLVRWVQEPMRGKHLQTQGEVDAAHGGIRFSFRGLCLCSVALMHGLD